MPLQDHAKPILSTGLGSLVDRVHDELRRLITDGGLADGERIVIDQFAKILGTSLVPAREALARLHAEGLVTFERNKSYRVAFRPTHDQLRQLFEARLVIEMGAAELAVARCDRKALDHLKAINQLIASGSYGTTFQAFRDFVTLNERFHVELVALADNPSRSEAYRRLGYHQQITRPTYGRGPGEVERFVREHEHIISALEAGDADAAREAVSNHIASGFERFNWELPPSPVCPTGLLSVTIGEGLRPGALRAEREGKAHKFALHREAIGQAALHRRSYARLVGNGGDFRMRADRGGEPAPLGEFFALFDEKLHYAGAGPSQNRCLIIGASTVSKYSVSRILAQRTDAFSRQSGADRSAMVHSHAEATCPSQVRSSGFSVLRMRRSFQLI